MRAWDERFQGKRFAHARGLVGDLERVGQKVGLPTAAVAVGWVLSQPTITAAIVGAKRPEQVRQNAQGASLADRPKVVSVIDQVAWGCQLVLITHLSSLLDFRCDEPLF